MSEQNRNALQPGFEFDGYRVERILGAGGFGITYLAIEIKLGRKVAIKEFLPQSLARRDPGDTTVRPISGADAEDFASGLGRFLDEAKVLVTVNHPNVVRTLRYTEAHGTAYIVMDYVEGESLGTLVRRADTLAQSELDAILFPLLEGLTAVHAAGFLHRDVKPDNIYIRRDTGQPVLLDFGAARLMVKNTQTVIVSHGYAPPEQYQTYGARAPNADLYSLGATLYRCMTGVPPVRATDRISARALRQPDPLVPLGQAAKHRYAPGLLKAVERALEVSPDERPQSVAEFAAIVRAAPTAPQRVPAAAAASTLIAGSRDGADARPETRSRGSRKGLAYAAVAALVLLAGAAAAFMIEGDQGRRDAGEAPRAAPDEARRRAEADAARKAEEETRRQRVEEERKTREEAERQRVDGELKRLLDEAERAIVVQDWAAAERALAEAKRLKPGSADLAAVQAKLEAARRRAAEAEGPRKSTTIEKTVVNDNAAKALLLGEHKFAVQWIDWYRHFGTATVRDDNGLLRIKGEQKASSGDDFLTIEGVIPRVDKLEFQFIGTITMKVSHHNGGRPCKRDGTMTFRITGGRKYWRLQEMRNPCDDATDYVDIFFR